METLREIIGDFDVNEPIPDVYLSYDAGCAYCVNLESRFAEAWPELADVVKKIHICIPALHIQNHQEKCMYWFSTAYLECVGHFHGETAEHEHPELNKLGPQVMQMNHGH